MSKINIVLGSHGSGKSTYVNDKIFNLAYDKDGKLDLTKRIFLIVPEQENFMKQKEIINYKKNLGEGILNVDCISFDRLCYLVFEKTGENYKYANDDLKVLIIRLAINELKKEKVVFKYFDFEHDNIGIYSKIKSALSEFSNYGINEKALDNLWKTLNEDDKNKNISIREKNKIEDLKIIQKKYYEILNKNNYKISEEKLSLLDEDKLKLIFNNSYCFFDGFTGFTPLQRDTLKKMLKCINEAYITVDLRIDDKIKNCIDNYNGNGFNVEENDIFKLSVDYIKSIEIIRQDLNIKDKIEFIYPIDGKLGECVKYTKDDFKLLEKNIFKENKENFTGVKLENIVIFKGLDSKNEIEQVANEIIKLVRNNNDLSFDDIKLVTPDINVYKNIIMDTFRKKNIPLFIDDEKDVLDSPLISSVKNLLIALKYDFMNDTIMKYIKSGLYNFNDELFYLDNLAKEYNFYNLEVFDKRLDDYKKIVANKNDYYHKKIKLDKIIEIKNEIIKPLKNAKEKLKNTENPINTYVDIIKEYLKDESIIKRYQNFIIKIHNDKSIDQVTNKMLSDNMDILNSILDKLSIVNDDENKISIDVFNDLFNLCLTSIHYKTIPMQKNQVVAGDLIRSRYNNPKIVFFVGVNESLLPPEADDTNLINDSIKNIFENNNYELSFTNFNNTINTKFYTYLAVTSPLDKLYLSYSEINSEGYNDFKSFYLTEIENIFKKDKDDNIESIIDPKNKILYNKNEVSEFVRLHDNDKLSESDKKIIDTLKTHIDNDKFTDAKVDSIKEETIDMLFDTKKTDKNEIEISTTSVEAYARCPFQYFAEKLLNIYKREEFGIESNLLGNINHSVMQKIDEIRSEKNNDEVYDLISDIDKNKYIDIEYLDNYFINLNNNKYNLDKDKFINVLNCLNKDCENRINNIEYSTLSYDLKRNMISINSIKSLIKETKIITMYDDDKELMDDIIFLLDKSKSFYSCFKFFEKAYIKDEYIAHIKKCVEEYKDDEFEKEEDVKRCEYVINNINRAYEIMKNFISERLSTIPRKTKNNYKDAFIKYSNVEYSVVRVSKDLGFDDFNVFLNEISTVLENIIDDKNLIINNSIANIVDKLISEMFYIDENTNFKDINKKDFKNDRKFKDTKLGNFLLIRTKEVLSKTLYNLVINDIYRMDSILSKVEYEINKYKIEYDNSLGEGKKLDLKVLLNGRIDKFIVGGNEKDIYIEIVDYKSSNKKVSLDDIKSGKDLRYIQTLIYLSYLLDNDDVEKMINNEFDNNTTKNINKEPVGSFYQGIIDEYNESVNEGDDILNTSDSYKMTGVLNKETVNVFEKGLEDISDDCLKDYNIKTYNQGDSNSHNVVNKEEFLESIKLLKNHIVEKVNEIKNGNIKPNPYKWSMSSNCDYCNLKSLCKREDKFDMGEEDDE